MVDLGGYIIILMNDNGKIKLYGSSADNADNPEVGDEILEVNGRTLENATDAEVSQYIHQCIKSGTISLQVTRRTGNKMKELDGPNADRIRDAWVIALERGARERLQKLPALRKIQPRDIQAILHQQITDGSASTSTDETPKKDVTNSHITVTLAEAANRNVPAKLSNGTVPKGVAKEDEVSKERKDVLEKQRSCPEETNLLQPVPGRAGERRASSPFQNGRTEVLIGEPEGAPRSPRGSTSSTTNDVNLLIPPGDPDYPESIYKSRRRSSGVGDIHLQPSQLQENNNGVSRDIVKGGVGVDSRETRVDITSGPNEMWAPGSSPGHNRELPVDVPDSLLQQAYANKQVMSLMLNRSETTLSSSTSSSRNIRHVNSDDNDDNSVGKSSASDHEIPDNNHHHHHHHRHHHHNHQHRHHNNHGHHHHNHHENRHQGNILSLNVNDEAIDGSFDQTDNRQPKSSIDVKDDNENHKERSKTLARIIEISLKNDKDIAGTYSNKMSDDDRSTVTNKMADDARSKNPIDEKERKYEATFNLEVIRPFVIADDERDVVASPDEPPIVSRNGVASAAILLTKETSVDPDEDYPFAKEDYPTMLKTCSDDSASPRSSSGRSDSTAPLDASLVMTGKESPLYDARRIDLGSPCRSLATDMKIAPLFSRGRETTSFDNPAYGLATDLHDLHQGLLMRSDEVNDLTRLIDEQHMANGRKLPVNGKTSWTSAKEQSSNHQIVKPEIIALSGESTRSKKKSFSRRDLERLKSRGNPESDCEIDSEGLLGAGSTDDLLSGQLTNLTITRSTRRINKGQQVHSSSGYSTLRSDASIGEFRDQQAFAKDRSFLVVGNRSYREVAVDCPDDFVPVTKCHPVYPPPNKVDTIERKTGVNSAVQTREKRSIIVDERAKRMTTFCPDYGRLDSTIVNTGSSPVDSKDSQLPYDAEPSRTLSKEDKRDHDDDSTTDSTVVRSNDVGRVVSDLGGGNLDGSREKVRSRVDNRVHPLTRYGPGLRGIGPSSAKTLSHPPPAASLDDKTTALFRNANNLHRKNALSRNLTTNACQISTPTVRTTGQSIGNTPKGVATIISKLPVKIPTPSRSDYVNDRIPRGRSVIVEPEARDNSRNSLLEYFIGQDDESSSLSSTPILVYYAAITDNESLTILKGKKSVVSPINKNTDEANARLENAQNSMLSLGYRFNDTDTDHAEVLDQFNDHRSLSGVKKIGKKYPSEANLSGVTSGYRLTGTTRNWLSENDIGKNVGGNCFGDNFGDIGTKFGKYREHARREETRLRSKARDEVTGGRATKIEETTGKGTEEQPGLNGVKPAIPPRDQKRAPARPPKDNVRLSTRNNNIEQTDNANTPEPTQQQLHSIRKYQEQLRKRKEEDERQEYLNSSVRGSKKLQALESHTTILSGQENPAYAQDEVTSTTPRSSHGTPGQTTPREVEEPPKVLTYGEVVATLERLQLQLRNLSGALGVSGPGVEAKLKAVRTLLVQRRFATALATHQALKTRLRTGKVLKHHDDDASNLARDCVEVLEEWQTTSAGAGDTRAMVEELTGLLTSYEIEGLLLAHDSVISYVDGIQRKTSSSSSSPSRSPSPSSSLRGGTRNTDNIKIIRIEKTNEPLGATVRNEGDAVIIGRVVRGGAADKSGLFHEGDEVLEVNGVEMRGKSVNEVCDILAGMQGGLTFLVLPASTNQRNNLTNTRREDGAQIQHVRAHFDYDPEEDPYIPCRELGVSFQKGDVLHVISQEDSNWWQAYREGEEDHTLAGLIPSRAFQHQRESMKQTIAGGKSTIRGSKKSSTLLCTRKNPKKKKKRTKFGSNFNDEGYPLYATTTIDDYDSEEVLTYEEVALYYPRANHKRPIVLIGPPNIGRHELRQRLMQDSERFAAAIPHTSRPRKGSEVDGQDYHFISRSQFESDILGRKFVEHGEYEKAYYGTSVEAIRSVVNSGKICVLNLHPQSLKILRSSDLKPYVVFVAPPSLEKLRQKRIKNNESFKEEELKDIIEKAREMEDKYGHLFDMIILNNDTDRAYNQLLGEINSLEREPQWVPASWVQ